MGGLRLKLYFLVTTYGYSSLLRFFLFFCNVTVIFISVNYISLVEFLKLFFDTSWSYYESIYSSIFVASMFLLGVEIM